MNSKIIISKKEPFIYDQFDRRKQIENLYNLISISNSQFVSCINSEYGRGKTTFFKMFEAYILNKNEGITPIYYDAWENDNFDNPLVSLMSCMSKSIVESRNANSLDVKKTLEDIGKNITKVLSLGAVDIKELESILNETTKRNIISEYEDVFNRKRAIKDELKNIEGGKKIFFIDELDRCKPTFALKLLEVIKHYFDTDKYYFMLAVDKKQLYSTIRKTYGETIDSEGYLKRFIDFDITMTPLNHKKYLTSKLNTIFSKNLKMNIGIPILSELVEANNLSLREIDKIVYYMKLILKSEDEFSIKDMQNVFKVEISAIEQSVLVFMIYLKVMHGELYDAFLNGTVNEDKRKEFFNIAFLHENNQILENSYFNSFVEESQNMTWYLYDNCIKRKCTGEDLQDLVWSGTSQPATRYHMILEMGVLNLKSLKLVQMISDINPE